ncbi:unnamed protein product [Rotaria socialis]
MDGKQLDCVRSFKYLGFEWTDKLSLAPTVDRCIEKIKSSYIKLKWLKRNKHITTKCLSSSNLSASELFRNFTSQTNHTNAC